MKKYKQLSTAPYKVADHRLLPAGRNLAGDGAGEADRCQAGY